MISTRAALIMTMKRFAFRHRTRWGTWIVVLLGSLASLLALGYFASGSIPWEILFTVGAVPIWVLLLVESAMWLYVRLAGSPTARTSRRWQG